MSWILPNNLLKTSKYPNKSLKEQNEEIDKIYSVKGVMLYNGDINGHGPLLECELRIGKEIWINE